jgi:hypothetical protein
MRVGFGLHGIVLLQLVDVRARDKGFLPCPGQDGHAHFCVIFDLCEHIAQLAHGLHVQCVEHLGTINGDVGDGVFLLDLKIFVVHAKYFRRRLTGINTDYFWLS